MPPIRNVESAQVAGTTPEIFVLAGVNGSGKSSIGGAWLRKRGGVYFNPDEVAEKLASTEPNLSLTEASIRAWNRNKTLLERAINERSGYAFETTLGGQTITDLLMKAIREECNVSVWYVGLASPEMCIDRVKLRVSLGGHDIPKDVLRMRYVNSPKNLVRLLPGLRQLMVYDNSEWGCPNGGGAPKPKLLLHMEARKIRGPADVTTAPEWAKLIVEAAIRINEDWAGLPH